MESHKVYLIFYNSFMFFGWAYLLFLFLCSGDIFNSKKTLYQEVSLVLKIFQTGAALEVVHAFLGFVRSNPLLTAFQVYSRVFVLWGVLVLSNEAQRSYGLPLLLMAWTITEIIRYSFYAFSLLGKELNGLVWLRYTLFIVLYPIGVSGELLVLYSSLKTASKNNSYSISLPNALNFSFNFYYFLLITMFLYIPIFPKLYFHMFAQRKKVLKTK